MAQNKMWAGRTAGAVDRVADYFNSSIHIDSVMYKHDVKGSIAHATMLAAQGIISSGDAETIISAGDELPQELRSNFMGVIVSEADRMTRIVKDLLTLSKFDYGKMEMNIARFSFAEAVGNVYKAVQLDAQQIPLRLFGIHHRDIHSVLGTAYGQVRIIKTVFQNIQACSAINFICSAHNFPSVFLQVYHAEKKDVNTDFYENFSLIHKVMIYF